VGCSTLLVDPSREGVGFLLAASRGNASQVLREAAMVYKVDTEAIAAKVKLEFGAKDKAKAAKPTASKQRTKGQAKAVKQAAA
jgi:ParB family chromosome partitioning protein